LILFLNRIEVITDQCGDQLGEMIDICIDTERDNSARKQLETQNFGGCSSYLYLKIQTISPMFMRRQENMEELLLKHRRTWRSSSFPLPLRQTQEERGGGAGWHLGGAQQL